MIHMAKSPSERQVIGSLEHLELKEESNDIYTC